MNKHQNQDKGFTLVELLIVIVILGILATVTVFAVGGIQTSANENACAVEQKQIETAAAAHLADTNTAPTADADLAVYVEQSAIDRFAVTYGPFAIATGTGTDACTAT